MTLTVRWTRRALARLDEIGAHIAKNSPAAAGRTVALLAAGAASLRAQPMLGRPGRIEGTRELVVTRTRYLIAYRVHDQDVEILTVLHGAQAWPERL